MKKIVLLVFLAALPEMASASGPSPDLSTSPSNVFTAGEITVTGKKDHGNETVTSADMEKLGKTDITSAANLIPGVHVSEVGGRNEGMIYVRGFDMRQVPLYLDGIPLYVPYDGYIDPNRFTTFDLSEITVSKGYTSVIFGPNTLGGAINMVSRKPVSTFEGSLKSGFTYALDRKASEFGSFNFGSNQGSWYVQGALSTVRRDFIPLSGNYTPVKNENGGERDNSDTKDIHGSLKVGYTPNSTDEYAIIIDSQHARKGVPVYAGTNPTQTVRYWRFGDWDKSSVYYIGRTALDEKSYLKTRTYFDNYYNTLDSYDDATYSTMKTKKAFASRYNDKTYGGSVEYGRETFKGNTLKLALHDKYDMHNEIGNTGDIPKEYEDNTFSMAAEDTWAVSKDISVNVGVRQDFRNTVKAEDLVNNLITSFPLENNQATSYQAAVTGRIDDHQKLTAYLARTTRFPTLKDRYSYRLGNALPNPGLKPEESWNYGLDYSLKPSEQVNIQASLYQSKLSDVIQQVNNVAYYNNVWVYQFQNAGKATYSGFECSADWLAASWLKASGGYSYIDRKNDSNPALLFTDLPKHKLTGYLQFLLRKNTWALVEAEYNSRRYSTSDGKFTAGNYGVVNLRLNAGLLDSLSLQASVENLFDRNYEVVEGYPESGRIYMASITYAF